ncbi:MAG: lytic murein transglycosylase [Caulobacteraceae bacterium]|nr:lytic murein transglycosylase [Caulobacteraceae bacterium]
MDRRAFIILTLAGAADPAPLPPPVGPAPETLSSGDTQVSAPQPIGDPRFDRWVADFMVRALSEDIPADVLAHELSGLTPDPRILALDSHQPEFSKPVGDYVKGVISDARVATGQRKLAELTWLPQVETRYGVAAEVLIAVWAVETAFGATQGGFDAIRSLATLAAAGRRQEWAEGQIIAVMRIIASHEATRAQLKGSWTGALGQTQFEPSEYLATAVDFDGDGRRDVWGSTEDALASAAHLLVKGGWRRGERWQREMILPAGFDYGLTEGPTQPLPAWTALGARTADGMAWSDLDAAAPGMMLCPAGAGGPAFLALPNHFALRQYNNSMAYALGVGLLADRIAGRAPLVTPWPAETPLSLADRNAAQAALARLGYDPGGVDGMVGAKTRSALRQWQKARGLPADGYLSPRVAQRLVAEAGVGTAPAPVAPN